jgi:hypothetical protein
MISKYRKVFRVTTLVVTLALMQAFVGVGFTATVNDGPTSPVAPPVDGAGVTAVLTTSGNQPIMVNDASTLTGATILNGDSIETPAAVGGMISIPGHGRLEITPNAKLTLGLDSAGNLKVNLLRGCVVMSTNKGTAGEVYNAGRTIAISDSAKDEVSNVCSEVDPGQLPTQGNNWNNRKTAAVVIGVGVGLGLILYFALRNNNPSPSTP